MYHHRKEGPPTSSAKNTQSLTYLDSTHSKSKYPAHSKSTCQWTPYLNKPPSCRSNEQRQPDSCKTHPKEETSPHSPMGTAQKATVVLITEKRFSLPSGAFHELRSQEWNWKLFAFLWSLLRLWIMSFNCAYTRMLGWINWLDLSWLLALLLRRYWFSNDDV